MGSVISKITKSHAVAESYSATDSPLLTLEQISAIDTSAASEGATVKSDENALAKFLTLVPEKIRPNLSIVLRMASEKLEIAPVRCLLRRGINPNETLNLARITRIANAKGQNFAIVRLLAACGADVNSRYADPILKVSYTALHVITPPMCEYEINHTILTLLNYGADIDARDSEGNTALILLQLYYANSVSTINLLLKHGASITATDNNGIDVSNLAGNLIRATAYKRILEMRAHLGDNALYPNPISDAFIDKLFNPCLSNVPSLLNFGFYALKNHEARIGIANIRAALPIDLIEKYEKFRSLYIRTAEEPPTNEFVDNNDISDEDTDSSLTDNQFIKRN